jgi:lysozyme family protein
MIRSEKFIRKIIISEGGDKITDDPNDAGGLTKYGICQRSYPHLDIRNLTEEKAIEIYTTYFCNPCRVDLFKNELLALHVFDFAVNSGVVHSVQTLQKAIGVKSDGHLGSITINAANFDNRSPDKFIQARKNYYIAISERSLQKFEAKIGRKSTEKEKLTKTQYKYLEGWLNRVNNLSV